MLVCEACDDSGLVCGKKNFEFFAGIIISTKHLLFVFFNFKFAFLLQNIGIFCIYHIVRIISSSKAEVQERGSH